MAYIGGIKKSYDGVMYGEYPNGDKPLTGILSSTLSNAVSSIIANVPITQSSSWVGIPDPQTFLGLNYDPLNPVEPENHVNWPNTEATNNYYIDYALGNDSGRPNGCPTYPRQTLPATMTLGPGDKLIIVGDGNQYDGVNVTITVTGTSNASNGYAWIEGIYSTSKPIISERRFEVVGQYYILKGIHHKADGQDDRLAANDGYATVIDFELTGTTTTSDGPPGSMLSIGANSVYYNGVAHDWGRWETSASNDMHGMKINGPSNVFVLNFLGYHLQGDTVQVGNQSSNPISQYVFLGNVSGYENKENNIDIKDSLDVIISGGYSHTMTLDWADDGGEAITIHYRAAYTWVINHLAYNCNIGIYTSADGGYGNLFVIGCVIYNTVRAIYNNAAGGTIANCTLDIYDRGIHFMTATSNPEYMNCAFSNRQTGGIDEYDVWVEQSTDYSALTADYNAYEDYRCKHDNSTYVTNPSSWNGDDNAQLGDHTYVNEVGHDYTPDTGSHLIANSSPNQPTAMSVFESRYSWATGMTWKDLLGNTRPVNYTDWDIGAIQS